MSAPTTTIEEQVELAMAELGIELRLSGGQISTIRTVMGVF